MISSDSKGFEWIIRVFFIDSEGMQWIFGTLRDFRGSEGFLTLCAMGGGGGALRTQINFFLRLPFVFSRKHAIKFFDFS